VNKLNKLLLGISLALGSACLAHAAEIRPVNADAPGVGLNDPTPATPAGGNPGTSVGEQRRIVYQFAADLWGAVLQSPAQIRVQASFAPLRCDSTGTVLGSAGTSPIYILTSDGDPNSATLFHGALADALIGEDLQAGAGVDIISRFNASYGGTNPDGSACSPGAGWYYGLDGNTPAGLTNFLNVVMHEIAHGLGFSGFGNVSTGAPLAGYPDIYSLFVYDNNSRKGWYELSNTGRQQAVTGGNLVFLGQQVTEGVQLVREEKVLLRATGTLDAGFDFGTAAFGPEVTTSNFAGDVVAVNDGSATPTFGCQASPAGAYNGKIALVSRGACAFEIKVKHAENAGAIGVIVANNTAGTINMAEDPSVSATVPSLMVSLADGDAIRAALPGVNASVGTVPGMLAGVDQNGFARLYAPNPVQPGSSFSHYDTSSSPNALMEPAITSTLQGQMDLDLTPALFSDEGWTLNPGNALVGDACDTGIAVNQPGGIILGANVQAWDNLCLASSTTKDAYQSCVAGYKNTLRKSGLVNAQAASRITTCAAKRQW
jgi:hypothetical protein